MTKVSWKWRGKTYSGTLIPSKEDKDNRYARTENGKIKTLPKKMKPQGKKDRLDEAEGKKKGDKKKTQGVQARLDEAEGKKRGKEPVKKKKKKMY